MDLLGTVAALAPRLARIRAAGLRLGLVPTMGALHDGHLSLVRLAKQRADLVLGTVFVNPKQFGPTEDLAAYPRDLEGDAAKLASAGCDLLFAPTVEEMYPPGFETEVKLGRTTKGLCGDHRPGHFDGVTTVVLKLFTLTRADVAVFGEKDFQQLTVIRRMVEDLALGVEIVGGPLIREPDGVAMSSRNAYLSRAEREKARAISRGLRAAADAYVAGEREGGVLLAAVRASIEAEGLAPEYLELRAYADLAPLARAEVPAVILTAVRVGKARLLDNWILARPG